MVQVTHQQAVKLSAYMYIVLTNPMSIYIYKT